MYSILRKRKDAFNAFLGKGVNQAIEQAAKAASPLWITTFLLQVKTVSSNQMIAKDGKQGLQKQAWHQRTVYVVTYTNSDIVQTQN